MREGEIIYWIGFSYNIISEGRHNFVIPFTISKPKKLQNVFFYVIIHKLNGMDHGNLRRKCNNFDNVE
jgi:hypothetical protein